LFPSLPARGGRPVRERRQSCREVVRSSADHWRWWQKYSPTVWSGDRFQACAAPVATRREAVEAMLPYIEAHVARGAPLHHITRHMLGLYHAQAGGRFWRQVLTVDSHCAGAGVEVIHKALAVVEEQAAKVAA